MLKRSSLATWGAAVLLLSSLSSCEDILEQYFPKPTPPPTIPTFPPLGQDISFYALSGGTKLDAYSTKDAATRLSSVSITGLGSGETLLAIDFRPATGQLYGVSSGSRLYVINQNTGAARAIGSGAFTPALGGNLVGFDFNPTVDRIRLVTSTGQNLRVNPETGTVVATDGAVNGVAGATLTGVAYTNNTAGATTTALYAINTQNQQLYLINPPNDGTVVQVGNLNVPVSGNGGFDIDATTGTALGLYPVNGNPTLFTVDLTTGAARPLAQYAASTAYAGLAIPTQPVAYATTANSLYIFNIATPAVGVTKPITGLAPGESVAGIDFRPANGQLYAIARTADFNNVTLYTINAATAAATRVGPLTGPTELLIAGPGFDFDPVADRIRIISGQRNVSINPVDATFIEDGLLHLNGQRSTGLDAGIASVAYDNNYAGATTATLYAIFSRKGDFAIITQPAEGIYSFRNLTFALDLQYNTGFDIGGMSNTGYAILTNALQQFDPGRYFYTIDLASASATKKEVFPFDATGFTVGLGF
ncbi:hypothetical protein GCM10011375_12710 [Hymenobacter qilianensis]|uniref:Uncharacterized protein n=2 Tax=Hymenobacter qilianensis TaxID=1385715 RepID=A0ACB5PPG3_9BACT|nr:DUF4394 domain-containing protein [Hymenobacter qilianensis]QNP53182.1 DUF4394 domain-containing protein [Hymenobacter qilianensis]GGF58996.1 hypothetical protein GCM10011375_12710 [Hymenobacter qilianensis]